MDTSCGSFTIKLDVKDSPHTTASFVSLARSGFYDDTTFHRIVPGFVIQGGCPEGSGRGGPGYKLEDEPVQIDRAPTPEAALLTGEADRVLDSALEELSEDRRAALMMRLDHQLSYGEIGLAMGWPLQKVKNEIHRARLQLRARILGYLEGVA